MHRTILVRCSHRRWMTRLLLCCAASLCRRTRITRTCSHHRALTARLSCHRSPRNEEVSSSIRAFFFSPFNLSSFVLTFASLFLCYTTLAPTCSRAFLTPLSSLLVFPRFSLFGADLPSSPIPPLSRCSLRFVFLLIFSLNLSPSYPRARSSPRFYSPQSFVLPIFITFPLHQQAVMWRSISSSRDLIQRYALVQSLTLSSHIAAAAARRRFRLQLRMHARSRSSIASRSNHHTDFSRLLFDSCELWTIANSNSKVASVLSFELTLSLC